MSSTPTIVAVACALVVACDRDTQSASQETAADQQQPLPNEAEAPLGAPKGQARAGQPSAQGAPAGAAAAQAPTKEQLKQFADAYAKVQALNAKYAPKVSSASSATKAQMIQQQASKAMVVAVNEAGLTPDEYSQIAGLVERDPALARQVSATMKRD